MPVYKVTYFFTSGKQGWTESLYNQAANPTQAASNARDLAKLRMALCGENVEMPYWRVSDLAVRGDSVIDGDPGYTASPIPSQLTQVKAFPPGEKADLSWTAVLVRLAKDSVTLGRIFMRGVADVFFESDRIFKPDQDWKKAFDRWGAAVSSVTNGWVLIRKPKSTPANTFRIVSAATGLGTPLVLTVAAGFAAAAGDSVAIRGLKTDLGSTFSKDVKVISWVAPLLTVFQSFIPPPDFIGNTGTVQVNVPAPVTGLIPSYGLPTTRHSGRPFGVLPGRRRRVKALR